VASSDLLQGTLDLLILKALMLGPKHGLGVARRIEQMTQDTFQVRPGSLFPALHRLEEHGWLVSHWGVSENNRKARFYTLTRAGKAQFKAEVANWDRVSCAINLSLAATS
jgi:PadR family transcriptional regulator PadR